MPDFNVRSDSVNVEQIMEQIRARIREKRGVDYTEQQIRELAAVKLENSSIRAASAPTCSSSSAAQPATTADLPNYAFEDDDAVRYASRRRSGWIRRLLQPAPQAVLQPEPADPRAAHPVAV